MNTIDSDMRAKDYKITTLQFRPKWNEFEHDYKDRVIIPKVEGEKNL